MPATLFKKGLWHSCFPVNFAKLLRTPFLKERRRLAASVCLNISLLKQTVINKFPILIKIIQT